MTETQLTAGANAVMALSGGIVTATVSLGPDQSSGPAVWEVDTAIMKTSRPGTAPIPRVELYLNDTSNPANLQFLSYDGSFTQAAGRCRLTRGQRLIAVWTGGQIGDIAYLTLTGTKK